MSFSKTAEGVLKKVSLEEVLAYREKRVCRRQVLLSEYSLPLACLGLNIPGEYKDFPWARRSFHEEIEIFMLALEAEGLSAAHSENEVENAGYTAYISVNAEPVRLKTIALRIEQTHPLGRLFDIDIFESTGKKLSRSNGSMAEGSGAEPRQCLICGGNGFICGRSRAHSPDELRRAVLGIMENWMRQKLGDRICSAAVWAVMSEAAVTPKPGLVDRNNSGAHKDMNFFTFIDSLPVLLPWFRSCALAGFDSAADDNGSTADLSTAARSGVNEKPVSLFKALRPPGKITEVLMKRAAGGVNSYRGYIFSIGILSAAYGRLFRNSEKPDLAGILDFVKAMTCTLGEDFSIAGNVSSHGEAVYATSGIQGIRGEVSRGFPTVTEYALPLLRRLLKEGYSLNDAGTAVLLVLLAHAEDTNMIHRGGRELFGSIQQDLQALFSAEPDIGAILKKAAVMDREFIAGNLSPGGSADLLGIAFFLYRLEQVPSA